MLALDVSNYTGDLSGEIVSRWREAGVGLVVVQAVDPPAPYPPGVTRQQLAACAQAGIPTDAYIYLWWSEPLDRVQERLRLLDGYDIGRVWLDIEDVQTGWELTSEQRAARLAEALSIADAYPARARAGIYTARWYWTQRMGNTQRFGDRPLWSAQYDRVPDVAVFTPYGGWTSCMMKQYQTASEFVGSGPVGLNMLSPAEAQRVLGEDDAHPMNEEQRREYLANADVQWGNCDRLLEVAMRLRAIGHATEADVVAQAEQEIRAAIINNKRVVGLE